MDLITLKFMRNVRELYNRLPKNICELDEQASEDEISKFVTSKLQDYYDAIKAICVLKKTNRVDDELPVFYIVANALLDGRVEIGQIDVLPADDLVAVLRFMKLLEPGLDFSPDICHYIAGCLAADGFAYFPSGILNQNDTAAINLHLATISNGKFFNTADTLNILKKAKDGKPLTPAEKYIATRYIALKDIIKYVEAENEPI